MLSVVEGVRLPRLSSPASRPAVPGVPARHRDVKDAAPAVSRARRPAFMDEIASGAPMARVACSASGSVRLHPGENATWLAQGATDERDVRAPFPNAVPAVYPGHLFASVE